MLSVRLHFSVHGLVHACCLSASSVIATSACDRGLGVPIGWACDVSYDDNPGFSLDCIRVCWGLLSAACRVLLFFPTCILGSQPSSWHSCSSCS